MVQSSDLVPGSDTVDELQVPNRWLVGPQWLEDSSAFNEWMSEEDYEAKQVNIYTCTMQ